MRLLSITLNNVRRFTEPVQVDGIADGLNILCEPNEAGKSTIFDAVQALFFVPHRSQAKEAKALRPHAGGAPEVAVWRFAAGAADHAAGWRFHPRQRTERLADGRPEVRLEASGWLEMTWHFYQWGDSVKVIAPEGLRRRVTAWRRHDFEAFP